MEKIKRYFIFLIGLFVNAFGVSFITKASLGTSPISSIPFVLSLEFPLTLGEFTILFSVILIALQIIILKHDFKKESLLQIPVSILFGYFIDFTMNLLSGLNPNWYGAQILSLAIGCLILGFGVYIEVLANVVMLPGEAFVQAITIRFGTNFGNTKVVFDASMALIAAILSFIISNKLEGVREGTIIAALMVGFIARWIGHNLSFIEEILFGEKSEEMIENDKV